MLLSKLLTIVVSINWTAEKSNCLPLCLLFVFLKIFSMNMYRGNRVMEDYKLVDDLVQCILTG